MIISLETIKFVQALFINTDTLMYCPESKNYPNCVCMTLHEELAKVKYIFTDKTGTLTQNIMEFRGCSIGGSLFENNDVFLFSKYNKSMKTEQLDKSILKRP